MDPELSSGAGSGTDAIDVLLDRKYLSLQPSCISIDELLSLSKLGVKG